LLERLPENLQGQLRNKLFYLKWIEAPVDHESMNRLFHEMPVKPIKSGMVWWSIQAHYDCGSNVMGINARFPFCGTLSNVKHFPPGGCLPSKSSGLLNKIASKNRQMQIYRVEDITEQLCKKPLAWLGGSVFQMKAASNESPPKMGLLNECFFLPDVGFLPCPTVKAALRTSDQ